MDKGGFVSWEKTLLHNFADDCVWHAIIPTMMVCKSPTWDMLKTIIDLSDKELVEAQKQNLLCALCKTDSSGKEVTFALRFLLAKRKATLISSDSDSNINGYIYRCAINTSHVCKEYKHKEGYLYSLDSSTEMHNIVLDRFCSLFNKVSMENISRDLSGPEFWNILHTRFCFFHKDVLKKMGKVDTFCQKCSKLSPKFRCSGCNYTRYCDEKCSHTDWSKHKNECKVFQSTSICYGEAAIKTL